MNKVLIVVWALLLAQLAFADVTGKWKTIDDKTGQPKSIIEIYQKGGKYYGRIAELLTKPGDTLCDKCPGDRKGKKLVGMDIITGMAKNGEAYEGGKILDPEKGKIYDCKLWEENGKLLVRGYLGFFYRTQTWDRAN